MKEIINIFKKPGIIGIVADVNQGKSMLVYNIIEELQKQGTFSLYTYGLRANVKNCIKIISAEELENIENSIIICDEFFTLFDLDNRKARASIEKTLRFINHHNNILVLVGVGENFKKFISAKIDVVIFKKITYKDLINGSRVKDIITAVQGDEAGTYVLNLKNDAAYVFNGKHYNKITNIPYLKQYDTKSKNVPIFVQKKIVPNNVQGEKQQ